MKNGSLRLSINSVQIRLITIAVLLLVIASSWISLQAFAQFERSMQQPVERKSRAIAELVGASVERALELGIPLRQMVGVESYMQIVQRQQPEIAAISIVVDGAALFRSNRVLQGDSQETSILATAMKAVEAWITPHIEQARLVIAALWPASAQPVTVRDGYPLSVEDNYYQVVSQAVMHEDATVAHVELVVDKRFFKRALSEVIYDILVVLVVSLLIAFEILRLIATRTLAGPIERLRIGIVESAEGRPCSLSPQGFAGEMRALVIAVQQRLERAQAPSITTNQALGTVKTETMPDPDAGARPQMEGAQAAPPIDVAMVRMPLFLFMFAEELSRSFLPIYAAQMRLPDIALDPNLLIGMPITLFMLVVTVMTPFAGRLVDRFGVRSMIMVGMVPGVAAMIGTASAGSLVELLLWRGLTAISYAIMFIGSQGYIARNTSDRDRTRAMGMFVAAIATAGVCGTSVGGIIAQHLGYRETFIVSSAVLVLAVMFVICFVHDPKEHASSPKPVNAGRKAGHWRNHGLTALLLFAAIPTKLLLTGYLFFLMPLLLLELEQSASVTGRVMMVYGLIVLALTPLAARIADRTGRPALLVAIGGAIAGAGPALAFFDVGIKSAILGVTLLGLGHALSISPQLAMVPLLRGTNGEGRAGLAALLGYYRMIERTGTILGPLLAGYMISKVGIAATAGWMGLGMLVCAGTFAFVFAIRGLVRRSWISPTGATA